MKFRKVLAVVAGASLPLAASLALAPTASAQEGTPPVQISETVDVTYTCVDDDANNVGGVNPWTNSVAVSHPESVAPGEFFTVTIRPGQMQANQSRTGRITYDIQTPDNVTNLTSTLEGNHTGFNSSTPRLTTVDATTKQNAATSNVVRIADGASAKYGNNPGTTTNSGLRKTSASAFQLPTVSFTMRAPSTPGEVVFGLPGAGAEEADSAANSQFAYVRGTGNNSQASVDCAVSANAARLAAITVNDVAPYLLESTTNVIGGDQLADSSIPTTLQAQVAVPQLSAAEISEGTVTFRDTETNLIVGTATHPNAQGIATVTHQFPRIPDGDPDRVRTIVAEYSGVPGSISPSQDTINLTLTEKPTVLHDTNFTVTARAGELDVNTLPVTVTATFARPNVNFPEGTMVQLYRDAKPVGEPIAMPEAGTSISFPVDGIPRAERTGTHHYTVELVTIYHDYNQWMGSTQNPATIIVTGTAGETVAPEPGTGSLDMGSITDPITSSLSDQVGYDVSPLSSDTVMGMLSSAS